MDMVLNSDYHRHSFRRIIYPCSHINTSCLRECSISIKHPNNQVRNINVIPLSDSALLLWLPKFNGLMILPQTAIITLLQGCPYIRMRYRKLFHASYLMPSPEVGFVFLFYFCFSLVSTVNCFYGKRRVEIQKQQKLKEADLRRSVKEVKYQISVLRK